DAFVAEDVLDLGGAVEGQLRPVLVDGGHHPEGMVRAVEEVGIAEGDVPGSGLDLGLDVGEDDVLGDDAEPPVVDHRDGAVPAPVYAAPAGLDVAGGALLAADGQPGVAPERRQAGPVGRRRRPAPADVDHAPRPAGWGAPGQPVDPGDEFGL